MSPDPLRGPLAAHQGWMLRFGSMSGEVAAIHGRHVRGLEHREIADVANVEVGVQAVLEAELLVARAIRNSTRPGERVYDPFLGSGTTLIRYGA